jgi:hypothetical protein
MPSMGSKDPPQARWSPFYLPSVVTCIHTNNLENSLSLSLSRCAQFLPQAPTQYNNPLPCLYEPTMGEPILIVCRCWDKEWCMQQWWLLPWVSSDLEVVWSLAKDGWP